MQKSWLGSTFDKIIICLYLYIKFTPVLKAISGLTKIFSNKKPKLS